MKFTVIVYLENSVKIKIIEPLPDFSKFIKDIDFDELVDKKNLINFFEEQNIKLQKVIAYRQMSLWTNNFICYMMIFNSKQDEILFKLTYGN